MAPYFGSRPDYGAIMTDPSLSLPPKFYEAKAPPMPPIELNPLTNNSSYQVTLPTSPPPCLYQLTLANQDIGSILFIIFVPVTCIIVILGLINNTLCYIIMRKFSKRSTPNIVMRVLAVADNMVLISLILYNTLPTTYEYTGSLVDYYESFQRLKGYLWFFMWFSKTFSVYTIVLMTVDRYVALCHPLKAASWCTTKRAWLGVVFVIFFSVLFNLPKFWYLTTTYVNDPCSNTEKPLAALSDTYRNPLFQHIYIQGAYIIVMYLVPLHVLLILNIILVNTIRKATRSRQQFSNSSSGGRDSVTERIIGVVTAFILLESPSILANVLIIVHQWAGGDPVIYNNLHWAARISYVLSAINSCINFYIYVLVGKRFRMYFISLFCKDKYSSNDSVLSGQHSNANGRTFLRQVTRNSILNGNYSVLSALITAKRPKEADASSGDRMSVSPQTPRAGTPRWHHGGPLTPQSAPPESRIRNAFFSSKC